MKKLFFSFTIIFMLILFIFASCGDDDDAEPPVTTTSTTSTALSSISTTITDFDFSITTIMSNVKIDKTSIDIDNSNNLHIAYYDDLDKLYYIDYSTNPQNAQLVDPTRNLSHDLSLAIDKNGYAHISYSDDDERDLVYANNISGTWENTVLESKAGTGDKSVCKIDSNNFVHIVYEQVTYSRLKYITNISGTWEYTEIDNNAATDLSMDIDSQGVIHIVYTDDSDNHRCKYAFNPTGSWVIQSIDPTITTGLDNSIALDNMDIPHVAYSYQVEGKSDKYLKYAEFDGGSNWNKSIIDDSDRSGSYTNIVIDTGNNVHIFYEDGNDPEISYITDKLGDWKKYKLVDSGDSSIIYKTSVDIDDNDKIYICYGESDNEDNFLKLATIKW